MATPQLLELSGLGHGCDIAAAYGWYLMGEIPAKASFLTEPKIKGGWAEDVCGSTPAFEPNSGWSRELPGQESSRTAARGRKSSRNTGLDPVLTSGK